MDAMKMKWIWTLLLALPLTMSLAGCGGKSESETEEGNKISLPTSEKPIDQSFITDDFVAAIVVHPSRIYESKVGKDVIAYAIKDANRREAFEEFLQNLKNGFSLEPGQIEQVIVLLDGKDVPQLQGALMRDRDPKLMPGLIVRSSVDFDEAKLATVFAMVPSRSGDDDHPRLRGGVKSAAPKKPEKKSVGGQDYYVVHNGETAFAIVDGKTLVGGTEATLKKMLAAKKATSPLAKRLATIGAEHDMAFVFAGEPVEALVKTYADMIGQMDPDAKEAASHAKNLKSVSITLSVTSSPMVSVVFGMGDSESASNLASIINEKFVTKLKEEYEKGKGQIPKEAVEFTDELMEKFAVGAIGSDLIIRLDRVSQLDNIGKILEENKFGMGGKSKKMPARYKSR
jgi:hypothetical protein